jgi:hypothetical protein
MLHETTGFIRCKAALKPYGPRYRPCGELAQWYYPGSGTWYCDTHGRPEDGPSVFTQPIQAQDLGALEAEYLHVAAMSDAENHNVKRLSDYMRQMNALEP